MTRQKYRICIDTLSFNLTNVHNAAWLAKESAKPIYNSEGERTGVTIEPGQFSINPNGKSTVTATFYRGGEQTAVKLARKHDLRITRLDLTLDIAMATVDEQEEKFTLWTQNVTKEVKDRYNKPQIMFFEGQANIAKGNMGKCMQVWARSSPHHLRIYTKSTEFGPVIRIEWQLRGDEARSAWEILNGKYPHNTLVQLSVWQGLTSEYLYPEVFETQEIDPTQLSKPIKEKHASKVEEWLMYNVAPAIARHFISTGVDLSTKLSQEVAALVTAHENSKDARIKSGLDKKLASLSHRLARKTGLTASQVDSFKYGDEDINVQSAESEAADYFSQFDEEIGEM